MNENNNIWLKTLFDYMEKNKIMGKERKIVEELINKNIKLNNIIKEVREYILQHCEIIRIENENVDKVGKVEGIPLLEILDKVGDEK